MGFLIANNVLADVILSTQIQPYCASFGTPAPDRSEGLSQVYTGGTPVSKTTTYMSFSGPSTVMDYYCTCYCSGCSKGYADCVAAKMTICPSGYVAISRVNNANAQTNPTGISDTVTGISGVVCAKTCQ